MLDRFGRTIRYLRISVTDRCNLRCGYCMPERPVSFIPRRSMLSFEELRDVAVEATRLGFDKLRLTGGEPLTRRDIVTLVAMLRGVAGVRELAMTTNGTLLARYATELKQAGLDRINVSLDTLDPARFAAITGGGDLETVLDGIRAAAAAGLSPVKLNCVVERSSDEPDARSVARYGAECGHQVRFIPRMDLATGRFARVEGGEGGDCARCNRLRLSCDGLVRPCLFSDTAFSVRLLGAAAALRAAIESKPASGTCSRLNRFFVLGG